jgi:hypothetical protein
MAVKGLILIALAALGWTGAVSGDDRRFCVPMPGQVMLVPEDGTCTVAGYFEAGLPEGAEFLGPGYCYAVRIKGLIEGRGYAGRTSEALSDGGPAILRTPVRLPASGQWIRTARAIVFFPGGAIRTSDLIIESGERASEQLVVQDGRGIYRGATGSAVVLSNAIGRWARFTGEVCLPY